MAKEVPIPIALLMADNVYNCRETGKWVIAGTFSRILTHDLPARHDQMVIFSQVTGVNEPVDLRVRIEHADSGDPIFEMGGPISAKTPLEVITLPIRIRQLKLEKAGKYWIQLLSDAQILIQSPLQVTLVSDERPKEKEVAE